MSKIIRTRKPSVLPYYAAALVFVVLCAVLPVYRLWALAAALENQLDALYAAESMDLSADLTVLQNMLKGQGLSK